MPRTPTKEPYIVVTASPKNDPTHLRWTVYYAVNGVPDERQGKVSIARVARELKLSRTKAIRAAEEIARKAANEAQDAIVMGGAKTVAWTVQSWCDHCATKILSKERDKRYATQVQAQLRLHVYDQLGRVPLSRLTVEQLETWWEWLASTPRAAPIYNNEGKAIGLKKAKLLSWKSRDLVRGYLSSCLTRAKDRKHIDWNPVLGMADDKDARDAYKAARKQRLRWFSVDELRSLLEGSRNTALYAPILIQINLAVRAAEACGLEMADVDVATGRTNIVRQLARKPRTVGGATELAPCGPKGMCRPFRASEELRALVRSRVESNASLSAERRHPYVVLNSDGEPMDPAWYSKHFRLLCETLGIPLPRGNSTHAVRRSVLNRLKQAPGLSKGVLAMIAGHDDEEVTDLYLEDNLSESDRSEMEMAAAWFQSQLQAG